jgi:hypothetical protein
LLVRYPVGAAHVLRYHTAGGLLRAWPVKIRPCRATRLPDWRAFFMRGALVGRDWASNVSRGAVYGVGAAGRRHVFVRSSRRSSTAALVSAISGALVVQCGSIFSIVFAVGTGIVHGSEHGSECTRYLSAPRPLGSPACRYQGYTYGNRGFGATRCKITGPSPTRGCSASPRVMQHYEEGTPRCLTKIDKIKEIHDDKVKYCLPPEWQSNYTHP